MNGNDVALKTLFYKTIKNTEIIEFTHENQTYEIRKWIEDQTLCLRAFMKMYLQPLLFG